MPIYQIKKLHTFAITCNIYYNGVNDKHRFVECKGSVRSTENGDIFHHEYITTNITTIQIITLTHKN